MAAAGFLTTPRGQRSVYLHSRVSQTPELPDYIYNSETNEDASADYEGIVQATLNLYQNADFNTIDVDAGAGVKMQNLSYNPITDSYDIKPGEYVL